MVVEFLEKFIRVYFKFQGTDKNQLNQFHDIFSRMLKAFLETLKHLLSQKIAKSSIYFSPHKKLTSNGLTGKV